VSRKSSRIPLILTVYERYLNNQDSADFAHMTSRFYSQGTLARLTEHHTPSVRRAAVFALGYLGDYEVNHVLGRAMHDEDRTVRLLAESSIRNVWKRAGNEDQRRQLEAIIGMNSSKQYEEASRLATELTEQAPWFAEAWNQRAVAGFALGRYADAIRDCHQALELNAYHFSAASGMGHAYLRLKNPVSALESFRRALRLNPNLEDVRAQVTRLARAIEGT
jgi:tetratricopeptide (TPR) repeat protein